MGVLARPLDRRSAELVVNKHRSPAVGGKTLADYGDGLQAAFTHVARVLKPTGRAVLAFSNSDDAVWDTVQRSLHNAGLRTAGVHLLNKGQPSIKGVKGVTGKERVTTFDLLLSLERRASSVPPPLAAPRQVIERAVATALQSGGRLDEIYSATVRTIIEDGHSVAGITMPTVAEHCRRLGAREGAGRWKLGPPQSQPGPKNVSDVIAGYLTPRDDLPQPTTTSPQPHVIPTQRVTGGRNSTLYLAPQLPYQGTARGHPSVHRALYLPWRHHPGPPSPGREWPVSRHRWPDGSLYSMTSRLPPRT